MTTSSFAPTAHDLFLAAYRDDRNLAHSLEDLNNDLCDRFIHLMNIDAAFAHDRFGRLLSDIDWAISNSLRDISLAMLQKSEKTRDAYIGQVPQGN